MERGLWLAVSEGKAKICIVIATAGCSGVESVVLNLVAALIGNPACQLDVITFAEGPLVQKLKALGVVPRVVKIRNKFDVIKIFQLSRLIRGRYDIVHSHGSRACFFASLAVTFSPVRAVVTVHQGWNAKSGRWVDTISNWIEKIVISWFSDYRVYVSKALRDEIEPKCLWNHNNAGVIHNCIENSFLKIDPLSSVRWRQRRRGENGIPDASIVIGCVGRLHPIKGQDYLIDAIALLQSVHNNLFLIVVGGGPQQVTLIDLIGKHGLAGKVIFTGEVDECASWYPCFDILVVPSLSESFGLVALEGYCYGLPVVITDCPGLVEVLGGYPRVFVARKGSAEEIAQGIKASIAENCLGNILLEGEMKERIQHFSRDRFGREYFALYQSLIGNANA